jgi:uncharacterized protein
MRIGTIAALTASGLALVVLSPPPMSAPARAASFNCAQAASKTEHAICGDAQLSALDGQIGLAYQQRLALAPATRQVQRGWLRVRDEGCVDDKDCLRRFMNAQLAWLRSGNPLLSRTPTVIGTCELTTISKVDHRFEGEVGSGSYVREANGPSQVSYDEIPSITHSRRGDPVLVCLAGLPEDCPPGDDRGKYYAAANLRTLGVWALADSEHLCGGA